MRLILIAEDIQDFSKIARTEPTTETRCLNNHKQHGLSENSYYGLFNTVGAWDLILGAFGSVVVGIDVVKRGEVLPKIENMLRGSST